MESNYWVYDWVYHIARQTLVELKPQPTGGPDNKMVTKLQSDLCRDELTICSWHTMGGIMGVHLAFLQFFGSWVTALPS